MTTTLAKGVIEFGVKGEPKGQPRPRAFARVIGGKAVARVYDAGTAEGWKSLIAEAVRPHLPPEPLACPLRLSVTFYMPRPKSHYRGGKVERGVRDGIPEAHTGKPDLDNMLKAVKDALSQVGLWADDCQVCEYGKIEKRYTLTGMSGAMWFGGTPGAWIKVEQL